MAKIKVGEIPIANLPSNLKSSLPPYIPQGEEVFLCYHYSLEWSVWDRAFGSSSTDESGAYVITKRHALRAICYKGVFRWSSPTIDVNQTVLEHVIQIKETTIYGRLYGILLYGHDAHQPQIGFSFSVKNGAYQKFLSVLNIAVEKARNSGNKEELSVPDRLYRLTKLRNDGLISEEEFRHKREEILNRL